MRVDSIVRLPNKLFQFSSIFMRLQHGIDYPQLTSTSRPCTTVGPQEQAAEQTNADGFQCH